MYKIRDDLEMEQTDVQNSGAERQQAIIQFMNYFDVIYTALTLNVILIQSYNNPLSPKNVKRKRAENSFLLGSFIPNARMASTLFVNSIV